jgi:hypothetical protein
MCLILGVGTGTPSSTRRKQGSLTEVVSSDFGTLILSDGLTTASLLVSALEEVAGDGIGIETEEVEAGEGVEVDEP